MTQVKTRDWPARAMAKSTHCLFLRGPWAENDFYIFNVKKLNKKTAVFQGEQLLMSASELVTKPRLFGICIGP